MSNYILNTAGKKDIVKLKVTKKYVFNTPNKKIVKYKNVTLYDSEKINKIIIKKINKKLAYILKLIEESSDDSAFEICLSEIDLLNSIIYNKYIKFLKEEEYKEYLSKLQYLRNYLESLYYNNEEVKTIGR